MAENYVSVAEAKMAGGLRLVVTRGVPNPWGEAAKGLLHIKRIPHVRVAHDPGAANEDLIAWTGLNNAPIAILNDEPPRAGWPEIIMLAERLAPTPTLVPDNERDRAMMFGMIHALGSDDGYGWNRRLMTFAGWEQAISADDPVGQEAFDRMRRKYKHGGDVAHARHRLIAILGLLSGQLHAQQRAGSRFYIGETLSALDVYSACFMAMIKPLPADLCPAPAEMLAAYSERDPDILAAADPILLAHRDHIYENWLELPMRL